MQHSPAKRSFQHPNPSLSHSLDIVLAFTMAFAIFLIARPYDGIVHDGILYTVQALYRLYPENYSHDPFFAFGSQDKYTIFPAFHALWIRYLGIEQASFYLTLLGKLLWFVGLSSITLALVPGRFAVMTVGVIVSISPWYDGHDVFSYGESFASARLFSEALCFFALASWAKSHMAKALLLGCLALITHPLIALPSLLVIFSSWAVKHPRQALYAGIGCTLVTLGLATLKIPPFSSLLIPIDEEWLALLHQRAPYLFLENWHNDWISKTLILMVIGWLAKDKLDHSYKGPTFFLILSLPITIITSLIGSSLFHNLLITQLQLWRIFWIGQILAIILLANFLQKSIATKNNGHILFFGLTSSYLIQGTGGMILAIATGAGYAAIHFLPPAAKIHATRHLEKSGKFISILLLSLILIWGIGEFNLSLLSAPAKSLEFWHITIATPLFAMAMLWVATAPTLPETKIKRVVMTACTLALLLVATNLWFQRLQTTDQSFRNTSENTRIELEQRIPIHATVFWPGNISETWFRIQRSFYASKTQGAGGVFSRESAIEINQRQSKLFQLGFSDGIADFEPEPQKQPILRPITTRQAEILCEDKNLDFLILPSASATEKYFTFNLKNKQLLRLIECQKLRQAAPH